MDELNHKGVGFDKASFVAEEAGRLAAARVPLESLSSANNDSIYDHEKRATWAFDGAEALWAELCNRFPDDGDEDEATVDVPGTAGLINSLRDALRIVRKGATHGLDYSDGMTIQGMFREIQKVAHSALQESESKYVNGE